jgi:hypothetical protein
MGEGTAAVEEEVSTEAAVEEDSTAVVAADFMGAAVGSMAEEDSPAVTLDLVAAARLAAASMVDAVSMAAGALMAAGASTVAGVAEAGVAEAGADEAGVGAAGAGDLATAGLIGDMAGAIRMATTATAGDITRHTLIRIRPRVTRRTI